MSPSKPSWHQEYIKTENAFKTGLLLNSIPEVDRYIGAAFAFVDFTLNGVKEKATKHQDHVQKLFPILVQMSDLLRGCVHSQANLILSSAAIAARISLEARANLLYIFKHEDPFLLIQRLNAFMLYEELCYRKKSSQVPSAPEEFEREFAKEHPYWADKSGLIKFNMKWHGQKDLKLSTICESVGLYEQYVEIYMHASRWAHASPAAALVYAREDKKTLDTISSTKVISMNTLSSGQMTLALIQDFCNFFGVPTEKSDWAYLHELFLKADHWLEISNVR